MNREEAFNILVKEILEIGVSDIWAMDGEGRKRNNTYYQIQTKKGMRYCTNLPENHLKAIEEHIAKERMK